MKVEIFRTNVLCREHANLLLEEIHAAFREYEANFDLDDCDRILRIKSNSGIIHTSSLIELMHRTGYTAEVLPDTV